MTENEIINKVSNSSLITFNLEELISVGEIAEIDLTGLLYQGLILREKDVRDYIKNTDWANYKNKNVAVFCSADAVIPTWAFMLIGIALQPHVLRVVYGNRAELITRIFNDALSKVNWEKFKDAKVVIKGCSDQHIPESAYVEAATRLRPYASSIMYGEPCSTVPLYKKPR